MKSNRGIDTKLAPYEDQNPKILQLKNRKKLKGTLGFYILKKLGLKMGPLLKIFLDSTEISTVYLVLFTTTRYFTSSNIKSNKEKT